MTQPVVILVVPQMGENIGAVARAMANFGLSELRLVAPRDGWPNPKATSTAANAVHILDTATVYPDLPAAMHDVQTAYATTARMRDMEKRVVTPELAMQEMASFSTAGQRCALVFGPERTGLSNTDAGLCDTLITIPTSPDYSSLNIAQSVVLLGYEWFKASQNPAPVSYDVPPPAPKEDWLGLFSQLETYLDQAQFFRVDDKKTVMWQNLQNTFLRGRWSKQEVQTMRGLLRCIWERRRG